MAVPKSVRKRAPRPIKQTPLRRAIKELDYRCSGSTSPYFNPEPNSSIRIKTSRGIGITVMGRGTETIKPVIKVGDIVTKRYRWGHRLGVANEDFYKERFSTIRTLLELEPGAPLVRPVSMSVINIGKEKQIIWRERSVGVPVARLSPTKLGNEQYQRIMQKYYEARETLSRMAERHGYVVYDTAKDNAIYDYKKNRILFTDITFEKKEHPDA